MTLTNHDTACTCWQCAPRSMPSPPRPSELDQRLANRRAWQSRMGPAPHTPTHATSSHNGLRVAAGVGGVVLIALASPLLAIVVALGLIVGLLTVASRG